MPTETAKRFNSTLLDTSVLNALRKYVTVARQQGREDRAVLALELLSKFDAKSHQNTVAQHRKADQDLLSALQDYGQAAGSQGRADRCVWASHSFVELHTDPVEHLRDEVAARFAELEGKIATLAVAKKR